MSEKRVFEGIIRVSTENGWWLQIPNYDDCGRELDDAARALEDKAVRITIELGWGMSDFVSFAYLEPEKRMKAEIEQLRKENASLRRQLKEQRETIKKIFDLEDPDPNRPYIGHFRS